MVFGKSKPTLVRVGTDRGVRGIKRSLWFDHYCDGHSFNITPLNCMQLLIKLICLLDKQNFSKKYARRNHTTEQPRKDRSRRNSSIQFLPVFHFPWSKFTLWSANLIIISKSATQPFRQLNIMLYVGIFHPEIGKESQHDNLLTT